MVINIDQKTRADNNHASILYAITLKQSFTTGNAFFAKSLRLCRGLNLEHSAKTLFAEGQSQEPSAKTIFAEGRDPRQRRP